jgi:5'-nucleotidase
MRILLTNDDGYGAPGLAVMLNYLEALSERSPGTHEIVVIAPETERSGVSHAMSLRNPLKVRMLEEGRYTCSGTPADCVIVAGLKVMEGKIDLVISGINRGPNLGTDIIYSGTCGAARQAALAGIPAIAVSCARYAEPLDYRAGAAFVAGNLDRLAATWKPDSFINVNAPSSGDERLPARWAIPGRNRYHDTMKSFEGAEGYLYCYLAEGRSERAFDPSSDHHAVQDGFIALSLVNIHPESAHPAEWNGSAFF